MKKRSVIFSVTLFPSLCFPFFPLLKSLKKINLLLEKACRRNKSYNKEIVESSLSLHKIRDSPFKENV